MGVVAVGQIFLADRPRAAGAFGDILAGHFDMHAAGIGAFCAVHFEEALHFLQDALEGPGLVAGRCGDRVAMHRITGPDHFAALLLHGADQLGQMVANLVRAETGDQRQPTGLVFRVENVDQPQQAVRLHATGRI